MKKSSYEAKKSLSNANSFSQREHGSSFRELSGDTFNENLWSDIKKN